MRYSYLSILPDIDKYEYSYLSISGNIDKYEYLTSEELLPFHQAQMIEQSKCTCSLPRDSIQKINKNN